MKRQGALLIFVAIMALAVSSCASGAHWGISSPAVARVEVTEFTNYIDIGADAPIDISVTNLTDQELKGLTLSVAADAGDEVKLPSALITIDRIAPNGVWTPTEPFMVQGLYSGEASVFFTLKQDGKFLSTDYTIMEINPVRR